MEKNRLQGSLTDTLSVQLLLRFWKGKNPDYPRIAKTEKNIHLLTHGITVKQDDIPGQKFLKRLVENDSLRELNEILAVEVLTKKKTSGKGHEAGLVENLENTGEKN